MPKVTFTHEGLTFSIEIEHDDCHGAPWDEEDGHGPVSDWTTRDKRPGEMILNEDGRAKRFYDFAAAVKQARAEGWGFLPGRLETAEIEPGHWIAHCRAPSGRLLNLEGRGEINEAIRQVYAQHRATFPSSRAYHAAAAMADFDRLKDWCDDHWQYVGVIVTCEDLPGRPSESLWGIESDADEYLDEVAKELADTIISQAADEVAKAIA